MCRLDRHSENGIVERAHRTLGEAVDELELRSLAQARSAIAEVVAWYNNERLHSTLKFSRPMDYYRGEAKALSKLRFVGGPDIHRQRVR